MRSSHAITQPSIDLEGESSRGAESRGHRFVKRALPRARRIAIRVVVALVALWAIYLGVANAVGRSAWLQHELNADPQASQIAFDGFWTVVPGNFHLTNLHATFQYQTGTQVQVDGDRVAIDFALLPLITKHVVAKRLEIDGFVFHERDTNIVADGNPGIASSEVLDPTKAPPALWYDEAKSGWLIQIDDLEITHARELWFYVFRYVGDAEMHGAIALRPNRMFSFDGLRFDLGPGQGSLFGVAAMRDLHGRIEGTMDPIEPAQLHDVSVLGSLSVTTAITTDLEDLTFLDAISQTPTVRFAGTGGHVGVALRMDHGKLAAPGQATVDLNDLWIDAAGIAVTSDVHVDAQVERADDGPTLNVTTRLPSASLHDATMKSLAVARSASVSATIANVDFTKTDEVKLTWEASLPEVRVEDARNANALLAPHDVGFSGGSLLARFTANGSLPEGSLAGHAWASSDLTTIVVGRETTYSGKLSAGGDFARAGDGADLTLAHVFAYLDDGAARKGSGATAAWWAHVDIPSARVRASDGTLIASAHARFRDFDPVFTSIGALQGLPAWIHDAANLHPWDVDVTGVFGKKIAINSLEATAGEGDVPKAHVRLTYDNLTPSENLRIAIELGALKLGVEKHGPKVSVILSDVDTWYRRGAETSAAPK